MNGLVEIRTLSLKPGRREEFQHLYLETALPLLRRWNFDVLAHGPSLHDENTYYVIRGFEGIAQREHMEEAYYASDDWRRGPREAILALIEHYTDIVLELDEFTMRGSQGSKERVVEIRSYDLKPGSRDEFHRLFLEEAFPMLNRWNVDMVAYGPSLHDEDSYYLIRGFESLDQREQSEKAFYGSAEWRQGPREAILALIENYAEVVLDEITVQGLRK